jgi:predicted lactoylglutathione lyase
MKRFHMNLKVKDIEASTRFYANLFGQPPSVDEPDYKKWMLDDPFVNVSIEPATMEAGIAHVGLQAASDAELEQIYERIELAGGPEFREGDTTCCYAQSSKSWTRDPDGIIWEAFFTQGQRREYGTKPEMADTLSV